jgi:hypothetical protein
MLVVAEVERMVLQQAPVAQVVVVMQMPLLQTAAMELQIPEAVVVGLVQI